MLETNNTYTRDKVMTVMYDPTLKFLGMKVEMGTTLGPHVDDAMQESMITNLLRAVATRD